MGQRVLGGITMSLDGFVTGPNDRPGAGLGDGGERLHYWVFGGPWSYGSPRTGSAVGADKEYLDRSFDGVGAMLIGRTMHDFSNGWGDEPGFGVPAFVVTSRPHDTVVKGDTTFEFVTEGPQAALAAARTAAGERNVLVMGGANLLGQYLDAGAVDALTLTIAPVLLGAGKRMFDNVSRRDLALTPAGVTQSPFATHVRYELAGDGRSG
jgi:dihydrofolate reductase